jgi:23S rRNA (cytosine1962-C5)-methyltransferase
LLDPDPDVKLDGHWWHARLSRAVARRGEISAQTTAYRLIHAEGDGLPALICDRYDRWLVVQILSAGLEVFRDMIVEALVRLTSAEGSSPATTCPLRSREGLVRETVLLHGDVPARSSSTNMAFVMPRHRGPDKRREPFSTSAKTGC